MISRIAVACRGKFPTHEIQQVVHHILGDAKLQNLRHELARRRITLGQRVGQRNQLNPPETILPGRAEQVFLVGGVVCFCGVPWKNHLGYRRLGQRHWMGQPIAPLANPAQR